MASESSGNATGVAWLAAAVCLIGLAGCGRTTGEACPPGIGRPMLVFNLFFGRAIAGRNDITEQEWQVFRDDTVTTNLPNGYTVIDSAGAWMNPMTHKTVNEASRVLVVALVESPDALAAVNRIRTAYQVRFHQQLVGMTVNPACGSF